MYPTNPLTNGHGRLTFALSLIPIITLRLARLQPSTYKRTIDDIITISILLQLALHWSVTSDCLMCLKPFFRTWEDSVPCASEYWGSLSNPLSGSGAKGHGGADKSYARGGVLSKRHQAIEGSGDDDGTLRLRADHPEVTTKLVLEDKREWAPEAAAEDAIDLLLTSRIRVRTTTTMTPS